MQANPSASVGALCGAGGTYDMVRTYDDIAHPPPLKSPFDVDYSMEGGPRFYQCIRGKGGGVDYNVIILW